MAPSAGSSNNPQLTLEPCHTTKRIHSIQQWVSAFNIYVSVYTERFKHETLQLMKYHEVVRDMAEKLFDWLWYDEQFRYIRQSDPQSYPWDQIHWELWLEASSTVRKHQPFTNKVHNQTRQHFRQPFYPKGTCRAFQAGKQCSGCQFAINVGQNTRGVSAPSTQHKTVLAVSAVRAKALDLKCQALNIPPVTPVKVDRLEFLL